ncbi:hypothetical protein [Borrelia turicatae]|nr:hypothetical protein [Borrelia turicatae]
MIKNFILQGGYKTFSDFISEFKLARTQAIWIYKISCGYKRGFVEKEFT